ncbi:MAG: hypothetical protein M1817_003894 [Caeruleum heppii]|nr:MAG: hypothetical protein M1817_003894 [Caeruleum heppii]
MSRYAHCNVSGNSPDIAAGLPISEEGLFQYSNGHFLVDEPQQFAKRHVRFDVQELCNVVAAAIKDGSPICKIEKMEGGFCKALLMTSENGGEAIVKIPCSGAGRAMYSTASEAAVLQYVRSRTTIPVPKILAWSADSSNSVGVEYIIMEKAPGVQLFKVWDKISEAGRLDLIESLTQLESQLAALAFPAYGSLFHRHSITKDTERILLETSLDPDGEFCVGPACGPAWTNEMSSVDLQPDLDAGPWSNLLQFGEGLIRRSIARTRLPVPRNRMPALHGSVEDHINTLSLATKLLPCLLKHPTLLQKSSPTLWHTDLHMGNIFVSSTDYHIVSLIDWQSASISPLFLQVRWPVFLEPPEGYSEGTVTPKLSNNFEQLDADDQAIAVREKDQALCSKAYEVTSFLNNQDAYSAMWKLPKSIQELFSRLGDTWDDGVVPLRACLIRFLKDWKQMNFPNHCPIQFTSAEIASHTKQHADYTYWYEIQGIAQKYLNTDAEGWLSPEVSLATKRSDSEALLGLMIERLASEKSEQEVREMWPFPPGQ